MMLLGMAWAQPSLAFQEQEQEQEYTEEEYNAYEQAVNKEVGAGYLVPSLALGEEIDPDKEPEPVSAKAEHGCSQMPEQ